MSRRYRGIHRPGAVRDGQHTATPRTSPSWRMSAWLDTARLDVATLRRMLDPQPRHTAEQDLVPDLAPEGGER